MDGTPTSFFLFSNFPVTCRLAHLQTSSMVKRLSKHGLALAFFSSSEACCKVFIACIIIWETLTHFYFRFKEMESPNPSLKAFSGGVLRQLPVFVSRYRWFTRLTSFADWIECNHIGLERTEINVNTVFTLVKALYLQLFPVLLGAEVPASVEFLAVDNEASPRS